MNPVKSKTNFSRLLLKRKDISVFIATAALFAVFCLFDNFATTQNLFFLTRAASINFFISIGQVIVMIIGGMNLSLGGIGALSVITVGITLQELAWPNWAAIALALVVGLVAGVINGLLITKLRISSFMATLATNFVFVGLVNGISHGTSYSDIRESYTVFGKGDIGGIPYPVLFMIAIAAVLFLLFKYTVFGREMLATGGNPVAAMFSGIKTKKYIMMANVLSGVFAAMAGAIWVSRTASAAPATGSDWMLTSFAVAIIGGSSQNGGDIYPFGMIAGAFLMAMIKNGLTIAKADVYYEQAFLGLIILLAVSIDSIRLIVLEKNARKLLAETHAKA